MFYVYILKCNDGSLYTGQTDNLEKRIAEHHAGHGALYTAKRLPIFLVFSESFANRDDAFVVEQKIKGWSRAKKEALINRSWDKLIKLSNS